MPPSPPARSAPASRADFQTQCSPPPCSKTENSPGTQFRSAADNHPDRGALNPPRRPESAPFAGHKILGSDSTATSSPPPSSQKFQSPVPVSPRTKLHAKPVSPLHTQKSPVRTQSRP